MFQLFSFNSKELLPYIDWVHFFHAWQVKQGTSEAEELRSEAFSLLKEKKISEAAKGIFREVEARSEGDNLFIEDICIPLLRQQMPDEEGTTLCLSDFVSPKGSNIGIFATSSHIASDNITTEGDPYEKLLLQTLSTRLAEAAAEKLQSLTMSGIRPAVGYPCMPDLSIIFILNQLCPLEEIGVKLTENGAMIPQASVSGLIIPHPLAHYFAVGHIGEDQFNDYALRRGMEPDRMKKFFKNADNKP